MSLLTAHKTDASDEHSVGEEVCCGGCVNAASDERKEKVRAI